MVQPNYEDTPEGYYWVQEYAQGVWRIGYWDPPFRIWRVCGKAISHSTTCVHQIGPSIHQTRRSTTFDDGDVI